MPLTQVCTIAERMELEYQEMPELKLTVRQAQRLWNLSSEACESALRSLVGSGFLAQTRDGSYIRRTS